MKAEEWKEIRGFEGLYQISNYGEVKSLKRERVPKDNIVKKWINPNGYYQATLSKNGKIYPKRVHRLVAETFLNKIEGKNYVNHKDGNKLNNNIDNLEFCTLNENIQHAYKNNLINTSIEIAQYDLDGKFIKKWKSASEVNRELGICQSNIWRCLKGKRNQAGGFIWKEI